MSDMKIIGIGNHVWSPSQLSQAIEEAKSGSPIELKFVDGDEVKSLHIHYYDGPRWLNLVRQAESPDLLADILMPLKK